MIDFYYVVGYELKSGICKQFAIDRIGTVDVLDEKFEYENAHQKIKTDAFGISQGETFDVALKLSKRAHLLLRRHHPRTIPKINIDHQNEQYIYCDKIKGLEGVGKFVMGLLNDVQVLQPPELKAYIDEQIEKYQSPVNA
jgi:predicted DNA-binding transcriptional regulator YafY